MVEGSALWMSLRSRRDVVVLKVECRKKSELKKREKEVLRNVSFCRQQLQMRALVSDACDAK